MNAAMLVCCCVLFAAMVADLRHQVVPNLLCLPAALAGIFYHGAGFLQSEGIGFAVSGTIAGFVLLVGPFLLGGMGGGDVKLLAALGSWLGPAAILEVFVYSALAAGIYAAMWLTIRSSWRRLLDAREDLFWLLNTGTRPNGPEGVGTFPFTVPMGVGFSSFLLFHLVLEWSLL